MKVEKTVITETAFVAICVVACSAVMQVIFLAIGQWNLPVLYGNVLSAAVGILNFFLLGITVQRAVHQDEKKAKITMRVSMLLRYLMLVAVAVLGALLDVFNLYAVLIALLFPRVGITIRQLALKKDEKKEQQIVAENADGGAEDGSAVSGDVNFENESDGQSGECDKSDDNSDEVNSADEADSEVDSETDSSVDEVNEGLL